MAKSMLFQIVYSNFQTPKAQVFSECKFPRAWVASIHLPQIYWSLGASYREYKEYLTNA